MAENRELNERLFASDDDWQIVACINQYVVHDLDLLAEGYKTAADVLVMHIMKNSSDRNTLVYPIVYLYRHHVELRLKEIIREGNRLLDNPRDDPHHHELQKLWPIVKKIIKKIWPDGDSSLFKFIDPLIREFSKVDPHSISFRFSETKDGRDPLANMSHLSINGFAEKMGRISDFLAGVSAAICEYNQPHNY